MKSLWPKIKKLLTALSQRGELYMVNREMVYSEKINKMCTVYKLSRLTPADEYFKNHPEKKRKKNDNREHVREIVKSSFKDVEILLELADIYKGGDSYGTKATT